MRREGAEAVIHLEADVTGAAGGLPPDTSKLELHLTRGDGSKRLCRSSLLARRRLSSAYPLRKRASPLAQSTSLADASLPCPPLRSPTHLSTRHKSRPGPQLRVFAYSKTSVAKQVELISPT